MFPEGFKWGAASSAYQIEGAARTDGRGESVWDAFCQVPGKVHRGSNGDVACDHYHRMYEDVQMMKWMGLKAYRFSTSWSRVLPSGTGTINEKGLSFYDVLVDALLEAGIEPWLTLYHWDMPLDLQNRGGWMNPESPKWFADYAAIMTERLSDRVKHWITINEPQIFIGLGHREGTHAPGLKLPTRDWLLAGHHALMAHGATVQAIRAKAKRPLQVGWAPCARVDLPASMSPADIEAARQRFASVTSTDCWNNTWWADPVMLGHYPADGLAHFGADVPAFKSSDFDLIKQPIDFYGVNIYSGERYAADALGRPVHVPWPDGHPVTTFRWPVVPESLYWGPKFLHDRYKLPIVITENGLSNADWVAADGTVPDPQRIDFKAKYLGCLLQAARDGVAVQGYFHWSIFDNFEWAEGYEKRFGLIFVDYRTGQRIPKASAHWYRDVIAAKGKNIIPAAQLTHGPIGLKSGAASTKELV
ncbi:MAG: beta-glucosidase [Planctomycetes bacterium]|nr:beta-glucosidase [Planctomycetota bacterium]